jgi:hypothetical protein
MVAAGICPGYPSQGAEEIAAPGALYAVDFWRRKEKINSELLPPAAADRAWGVGLMERGSKREDEKLSTEAGQLQKVNSGVAPSARTPS